MRPLESESGKSSKKKRKAKPKKDASEVGREEKSDKESSVLKNLFRGMSEKKKQREKEKEMAFI